MDCNASFVNLCYAFFFFFLKKKTFIFLQPLNGCLYIWNQIRHSWKIVCDTVLFRKIEHTLDIPAAWTDHHICIYKYVLPQKGFIDC